MQYFFDKLLISFPLLTLQCSRGAGYCTSRGAGLCRRCYAPYPPTTPFCTSLEIVQLQHEFNHCMKRGGRGGDINSTNHTSIPTPNETSSNIQRHVQAHLSMQSLYWKITQGPVLNLPSTPSCPPSNYLLFEYVTGQTWNWIARNFSLAPSLFTCSA